LLLDFQDIFSWSETSAIGYPEDMGINRHGGLPKSGIQNHIGRFSTYSRECFKRFTRSGNFPAMLLQQYAASFLEVFSFGAKEADVLNEGSNTLFA
jgi:hypothetical protein